MRNKTTKIPLIIIIFFIFVDLGLGIYNIYTHEHIAIIIVDFIAAFMLSITAFLSITKSAYDADDTYKGMNLEDRVYPINSTIVIKYNNEDHSMEEVNSVFRDVCTAFPNNVVVALPDDMSIEHLNLEELENTRSVIDTAIEYARAAKSKRGNKQEVVVE